MLFVNRWHNMFDYLNALQDKNNDFMIRNAIQYCTGWQLYTFITK